MARAPHNSQVVLREYVEQQRAERAPNQEFNEFFEFFVPHLLLRDRGLSADEISAGLVGSGGDGGIDSMYVFVDDVLVTEDVDLTIAKNGAKVEVEIVQSKTERAFSEDAINRLNAISDALFSLNADINDHSDVYNESVRTSFELFRQTYRSLLRKAPTLAITYRYATFRPPNDIAVGLVGRVNALKATVTARFQDAKIDVRMLGAADLWDQIVRQPRHVRTLVTQRSSAGRAGYICLVSLAEMNRFLRDEDNKVSQAIFDENVRDWQGLTPVNGKIASELRVGNDRDFWWLNNGVTIICTDYRNDDNMLSITNPQIVNGLQTCKEISQYFDQRQEQEEEDTRSVLVKAIRINDDETRDRVIRATNSQNSVSIAMLRATDPFQRSIEQYLLPRDLYYERRKNYYSNRGRPSSKIISLTFLAQSALSILLFRPDDARARPSNPLKSDNDYKELFNDEYPLNAFYVAAYVCRFVELYMKTELELGAKEVNNLRFYVSLAACWRLAETVNLTPQEVANIDIDGLTADVVDAAYSFVSASYRRLGANDDAARGSALKIRLINRMRRQL